MQAFISKSTVEARSEETALDSCTCRFPRANPDRDSSLLVRIWDLSNADVSGESGFLGVDIVVGLQLFEMNRFLMLKCPQKSTTCLHKISTS